ncbi:SprT family zinc-dependent metalloprotease [uncultured Cohaesibacter sp.]|uniref:M48 family metallopeptidase n=1 Tax=uncultured Cohaesibacter sp. TaxID=1002546 RepID=UPI002930E6B8|nr:SprT family zinc-dependent metalloprotease [uncultured Cohaesibacter sp.]
MRKSVPLRKRNQLPETISLSHEGGSIIVRLRQNARAKRLILRLDSKSGEPVATCPPGLGEAKICQFLQRNVAWLVEKQQARKPNTPFEHGAIIPVRDVPHTLEHLDEARGTVRLLELADERILMVSGNESHMARRVTDWLKKQAKSDLDDAVARHAAALGVKPSAIRIKDTTSRWGSCSANRTLSFSWRIIMAPPFVLDYLAAHEVAHLREMNHSDRFWAHVASLCPNYKPAQKWLKDNGRLLHSYGGEGD